MMTDVRQDALWVFTFLQKRQYIQKTYAAYRRITSDFFCFWFQFTQIIQLCS